MSVTSETGRDTGHVAGHPAAGSRRLDLRPRPSYAAPLDRPLTSYYLLLGASTLLLTIGLMMVLSASSVYSYRVHDSSYYIFLKQLTWVLIGLPGRLAGQPDDRRLLRLLAWPAVLRRGGAALPDPDQPRLRRQRQPQLARARAADRAALRDRQARDRPLGRRRLRQEGELPRQPVARADPGGPGRGDDLGAGRLPARPRHRAGAVRDPARDALGGRRPGPAVRDRDLPGRGGGVLPRGHATPSGVPG